MSEKIVDEVCVTCGHSVGEHFKDVIDKVRCLHNDGGTNRMTGEYSSWPCSCVDYELTSPYQKKATR